MSKTKAEEITINYPVTVDCKTLWALILTGDAIMRNPKPERIEHWNKLRAILAEQCKKTSK